MDLNRYRLTPWQRFIRKLSQLFWGLGKGIAGFFVRLFHAVVGFFVGIGRGFKEFGQNFWYGDALTKSSHVIMGLGHLFRGQIVRGIIYFFMEVAFVLYMVLFGGNYLVRCFENFISGGSIGRVETHEFWDA